MTNVLRMGLTGRQFTLTAGDFEATIVEVGAGLRRLTHRGVDVTVPYAEDTLPPRCCGVVLVPWPNRIRYGRYMFDGELQQLALSEPDKTNAIHGLGRWSRWAPTVEQPSRLTLEFDVPPQKGYPFEVRVEVTYLLHAELGLSVTASAHNHGRRHAPFGAGFHPYLSTRGATLDATHLRLPAGQRLLLDDVGVPIGVQSVAGSPYDLRRGKRLKGLRMDDGFTGVALEQGRGVAEVRSKAGGARLWFDETFRYLQVFTVEDLGGAGPAVAIEPMTCAADAFNSTDGLIVLDPGGTWSGSWGIQPL
jgi:aldose 1-epimerase